MIKDIKQHIYACAHTRYLINDRQNYGLVTHSLGDPPKNTLLKRRKKEKNVVNVFILMGGSRPN